MNKPMTVTLILALVAAVFAAGATQQGQFLPAAAAALALWGFTVVFFRQSVIRERKLARQSNR